MAEEYLFPMPEATIEGVAKPMYAPWEHYSHGWTPSDKNQPLGLACLENWAVQVEALIMNLASVHRSIDDTHPESRQAAERLYGISETLQRLMKDFYDIHRFASDTLPYDPVARFLVKNAVENEEARGDESTGEGPVTREAGRRFHARYPICMWRPRKRRVSD